MRLLVINDVPVPVPLLDDGGEERLSRLEAMMESLTKLVEKAVAKGEGEESLPDPPVHLSTTGAIAVSVWGDRGESLRLRLPLTPTSPPPWQTGGLQGLEDFPRPRPLSPFSQPSWSATPSSPPTCSIALRRRRRAEGQERVRRVRQVAASSKSVGFTRRRRGHGGWHRIQSQGF
jgi:hypothetical protein